MATALPQPHELSPPARLLYHAAVGGDYVLRTGLASLLSGAMLATATRGDWRRERERLAFYAELADAADPAKVFLAPERAEVRTAAGRGPGVDGGRVEILRFDSGYVSRNPALRRDYARHVNNATARAQHWRHVDGPRPTLVVVHGFGASPAWFNTMFFSLREFFADGWDVVLFTLPFHGSRRGDRVPFNGVELFAHGMAHMCEGVIHAVHDFRMLVDHLQGQGVPRVGVTGLSLGGYTAALVAAVEPRLDFAVPNASVTWMPPLLGSWFPANVSALPLRALTGVSDDLLERALAVHSPLTYQPLLPKSRLMIVAGLGDRMAPPEQSLLLWEHWKHPQLHWFPGSHVLHFGRGTYLDAMAKLMRTPRRGTPLAVA